MKRATVIVVVALMYLSLMGCGATSKLIAAKAKSERSDVFRETSGNDAIPTGYADVMVTSNIKTHLAGFYVGESKVSAHGKETYPFLLNIDGQAMAWSAPGEKDSKPKCDALGKTSRDPEAGDGMQYRLVRRIRISAGVHTIFFAAAEDYALSINVNIPAGRVTNLEFRPVYRYKTLPTRIETFLKGISRFDAYADESRI